MRTLFHPFLPNGPSGDPVVWVDLLDVGSSVMLDLGDLHAIPTRKLLRVDRVVVTHTHMDHFIGFDQLLRVALGRERPLTLTGPRGFLGHVEGRIAGYTWNLIDGYPVRLLVEELDGETLRTVEFSGPGRMRPEPRPDRQFHGTLDARRAFTVHVRVLDHGIPVLGVALRETEHLSVDRDRLQRLGLVPGPWLSELKQAVRRCRPPELLIEAPGADGTVRRFASGELGRELLRRTPGQRIVYVTDLGHTAANVERVLELADGVDLMICEAAFLDEDRELAAERHHLTARQAGELARAAGARRLAPLHFSPRYQGRHEELLAEAADAFGGPLVTLPTGSL